MKRSLLLFLLAAGCCLSSGCKAKNQPAAGGGNAASANGNTAGAAKSDVAFARESIEALFSGNTTAAANALDWENLKVPGADDAGEAYSEMPDEEEREKFQQGFIEKYSESFKESGASVDDLKNWREQSREGERTIVAADTTTGKTMRVTVVRRDGRQLVSELSIE